MFPAIIGIGNALPLHSMTQDECFTYARPFSCETQKQSRFVENLFKKTGIDKRALVIINGSSDSTTRDFYDCGDTVNGEGPSTAVRMERYSKEIVQLAQTATLAALDEADVAPNSITHLVTASCTGFSAPGFDLHLVEKLGLKRSVIRTHIGFMGCHGALNALRVAQGYCLSNPNAIVLVCAAEICSLHFQFGWHSSSLVANSLFADGAASLVLKAGATGPRYAETGSYIVPESAEAMTWQIGDNGFVMQLANNVPEIIEAHLPAFISSFLAEQNLSIDEINGWAVHPGGPRILDSVQSCLSLNPGDLSMSRKILSECGNMSSPTLLFILQKLIALQDKLPCILLGFGPGLTIEAALIR